MRLGLAGLMLFGFVPLGMALWANRRTALAHALVWALAAWAIWTATAVVVTADSPQLHPLRYVALCLTGCAGVAVFGARRPHVLAWNFVVVALLAVMLLPLAETHFLGTQSAEGLRTFFLGATIAVSCINYLPTRLAPAALALFVVCEMELLFPRVLSLNEQFDWWIFLDALLAFLPWLAWVCSRKREAGSAFNRLWLNFRDRWGALWALRAREQFNLAAQNAGWPVTLGWWGLASAQGARQFPEDERKYLVTLEGVLQRFMATDRHM